MLHIRKVQKFNRSLAITLPVRGAEYLQLEKGDYVVIKRAVLGADNVLIIKKYQDRKFEKGE